MTFLAPLGLLSLLALPLIVVLHLLGARRRRQVVPSLMLWRGVPVRPEGRRWQRLPITPLLLLHLLAALLIGLALARPQLPGIPSEGSRHTAILLDTSLSMEAREGLRTRLDLARDEARAMIAALRPGDRLSIFSIGPQAQLIAEGGAGDAPLLSAALDRLRPGGVGADIDRALAIGEAALRPGYRRSIVVLSDGAFPEPAPRRLGVPLRWQTIGSDQPNRAIVTFATRPWQGKLQVYARVANYGAEAFPTTLSLYGGGELLGRDAVPLMPDGEYELTWSLPAGVGDLRAELDGADALPADDIAYLSLRPARPIRALLVSARPEPLLRALAAVPGVEVTAVDPSAYALAQSEAADLTVLEGVLPEAWPGSPTLLVGPPGGALLRVANTPRAVQSDALVRRGALLDGLSFSGVRFGDVQVITPPEWASVQLAEQGADGELPLVLRGRADGHDVAVWSFDLGRGNLPARLAFPLLVSRTVRDLTASTPPAAVPAGASLAIRPDPRADTVLLTDPDGREDLMAPGAAGALETLLRPGFYRVEERAGARLLYTAQVGVNAGSPLESRIAPRAAPAIDAPAEDTGAAGPLRQPVDLWPWLAGAGLAVLALEWLIVLRR